MANGLRGRSGAHACVGTLLVGLAACNARSAPAADERPAAATPAQGGVPALFAPLFATGTRLDYQWQWRVDPHDAEAPGPPAFTAVELACVVGPVRDVAEDGATVAKLAELTCKATPPREGDDVFPPVVATHWLLTADGIRRGEQLDALDDLDGVRAAVAAEPPLLASAPVPSSTSKVTGDQGHSEWTKVYARGKGWCGETGSDELYGAREIACFEPGRGLVSLTVDGREGPSEETYTLTRMK